MLLMMWQPKLPKFVGMCQVVVESLSHEGAAEVHGSLAKKGIRIVDHQGHTEGGSRDYGWQQ